MKLAGADGLQYFRHNLLKTAEKLKLHKGNDYRSLLHLQEKITRGGNDFARWIIQRKRQSKFTIPDSLLYEYAKCLFLNGFTTNKLPRETNRYKFVLYAWLQNEWNEYGPIFEKTRFERPKEQTNIPKLSDNIHEIYDDVAMNVFNSKLSYIEATDIIAFAEQERGSIIKTVIFYKDSNRIFIVSTKVIKKKHKMVRSAYYSNEISKEALKNPFDHSITENWLDLSIFDDIESLQNSGNFDYN